MSSDKFIEKIKAEILRIKEDIVSNNYDVHSTTVLDDVLDFIDELEEPKYKSNPLFDKCVENCDPEVMAEVNRNVDKMLEEPKKDYNQLYKNIAKSEWFKKSYVGKSLGDEVPDEQPVCEDLEEDVKNYFQGYWPGTETAEQCNTDLHFTPPAIIRLARHFYDLGCRRTAEKYDEIEYNRQRASGSSEKPNNHLEHVPEIKETGTRGLDEAAEDGADKLLNSPRDFPLSVMSEYACYYEGAKDGFKAGAEWDRSQGVTVEGEIMVNGFYPYQQKVVAEIQNNPFEFGDKVIVQIRKK